jgi:hypothetical protein
MLFSFDRMTPNPAMTSQQSSRHSSHHVTGSSTSSGPNDLDSEMNGIQLAQTFESTDDKEDEDLNSKPSPETNITKNNLFMNLRSGRQESLPGERALIQVFATNCDHCGKALKDLEAFSEASSDKGIICIALCVRGETDEARKFVPEPSGDVRHFHAGTDAANMIRQAASTADNIASVPFYMVTHENGTMIHVSRSRNDVVTVTNHHPTISGVDSPGAAHWNDRTLDMDADF